MASGTGRKRSSSAFATTRRSSGTLTRKQCKRQSARPARSCSWAAARGCVTRTSELSCGGLNRFSPGQSTGISGLHATPKWPLSRHFIHQPNASSCSPMVQITRTSVHSSSAWLRPERRLHPFYRRLGPRGCRPWVTASVATTWSLIWLRPSSRTILRPPRSWAGRATAKRRSRSRPCTIRGLPSDSAPGGFSSGAREPRVATRW